MNLTFLYLCIVSYIITYYKYIKSLFFKVNKIYYIDHENKIDLYSNYLFHKLLHYLCLQNYFNKKYNLIKIELCDKTRTRDIILEKQNTQRYHNYH